MRIKLHAICPYFAMFPESFARKQIEQFSRPSEWVFDPFCGRGTTVLESLLLGRKAAGSDINPVAVCVSSAKAYHPTLEELKFRIDILLKQYERQGGGRWEKERQSLPSFFKRAFYPSTLRELLFLRSAINWQQNHIDCFIAAMVVGSLHGEMDRSKAYFSNQMPRTICLKPDYSLKYWKKHNLFPKKRETFKMLKQKAEYRLKDLPNFSSGIVKQADARKSDICFCNLKDKISLIVTSPPYLNVTCYEEDQWLRLWFLGGDAQPTYGKVSKDDRYCNPKKYWQFLSESWSGVASLMKKRSIIVVRLGGIGIGSSDMTKGLKQSIKNAFPNVRLLQPPMRSKIIKRQAKSFLPQSTGCLYEMDYIFEV